MKIMFVDDRPKDIFRLWEKSQCGRNHELMPFEAFESIERTIELVEKYFPDVLILGYGLSQPGITGADVVKAIRLIGWTGYIIANSGGGQEQFEEAGVICDTTADRNPQKLKNALVSIERS